MSAPPTVKQNYLSYFTEGVTLEIRHCKRAESVRRSFDSLLSTTSYSRGRVRADRRRPPPAMPGLGAADPADLEAHARVELGFSRRLEQPRRISPYPGFGGGGGYPVWYHEQQLQRVNAGEAIDVSLSSIYRWCLEPFR